MFLIRLISIFVLAAVLGGCASDGTGLDGELGGLGASIGSLNLGGGSTGAATASLPSTDSFVKQQLERRGL